MLPEHQDPGFWIIENAQAKLNATNDVQKQDAISVAADHLVALLKDGRLSRMSPAQQWTAYNRKLSERFRRQAVERKARKRVYRSQDALASVNAAKLRGKILREWLVQNSVDINMDLLNGKTRDQIARERGLTYDQVRGRIDKELRLLVRDREAFVQFAEGFLLKRCVPLPEIKLVLEPFEDA